MNEATDRNNNVTLDSLDELINQLETLVSIESSSANGVGNDKVLDIIENDIKSIGFTTQRLLHKDPKRAGRMLVGELLAENCERFVTFISHSDTVITWETFPGFSKDDNGAIGYGPGVIDCKGGILIALHAIKAFLSTNKPNFSIRFIVSPTEEIGSPDFHDHLVEYGKDTSIGLGFEPGFSDGDIVHGRNGNRWYNITCHGKKVHSGREYVKGINAARALAHKILNLSALTDYKKGTTVCITHATCGDQQYNTMPGLGYIHVDSRFGSEEEDKRLEKGFTEELNKVDVYSIEGHEPAEITYEIVDYCPAITVDKVSQPLLDQMKKLISQVEGKEISSKISHGSADSNSLWHKGMIFIGGLGAIGDGMHTDAEKIKFSSLSTRALGVAHFLAYINEHYKF
jgi:glutamate carboxypeptidase